MKLATVLHQVIIAREPTGAFTPTLLVRTVDEIAVVGGAVVARDVGFAREGALVAFAVQTARDEAVGAGVGRVELGWGGGEGGRD